MPDTYSRIYIQIVFAVKGRESLIMEENEIPVHQYISGIIRQKGQKLIAINGMPDHIHILIGMRPTCCLSNLVQEVKKWSHQMIREKGLCKKPFAWQEGFGAFSYSHSSLNNVIEYINDQKAHHKRVSFQEEYLGLLKRLEVDFKEEHLFDWVG